MAEITMGDDLSSGTSAKVAWWDGVPNLKAAVCGFGDKEAFQFTDRLISVDDHVLQFGLAGFEKAFAEVKQNDLNLHAELKETVQAYQEKVAELDSMKAMLPEATKKFNQVQEERDIYKSRLEGARLAGAAPQAGDGKIDVLITAVTKMATSMEKLKPAVEKTTIPYEPKDVVRAFTGDEPDMTKRHKAWIVFKSKMRSEWSTHRDYYFIEGNDFRKINGMTKRLEGSAFIATISSMAILQNHPDTPALWPEDRRTVDKWWVWLDKKYKIANEVTMGKAEVQRITLKEYGDNFANFLTAFQDAVDMADMSDDFRVMHFRQKISKAMVDKIDGMGSRKPADDEWDKWVEECTSLWNNTEESKSLRADIYPRGNGGNGGHQKGSHAQNGNHTSASTAATPDPDKMDLDKIRLNAMAGQRVSDKERAYRTANFLCFVCGSDDHRIRDCTPDKAKSGSRAPDQADQDEAKNRGGYRGRGGYGGRGGDRRGGYENRPRFENYRGPPQHFRAMQHDYYNHDYRGPPPQFRAMQHDYYHQDQPQYGPPNGWNQGFIMGEASGSECGHSHFEVTPGTTYRGAPQEQQGGSPGNGRAPR